MRSYPSKEADPRSDRGAVRGRQEAQEEEQHQPRTGEGGDVGKLSEDFSCLTSPSSASPSSLSDKGEQLRYILHALIVRHVSRRVRGRRVSVI